jgi:hypothetical protein
MTEKIYEKPQFGEKSMNQNKIAIGQGRVNKASLTFISVSGQSGILAYFFIAKSRIFCAFFSRNNFEHVAHFFHGIIRTIGRISFNEQIIQSI